MISPERRAEFIALIVAELENAYQKHGAAEWNRHEFYGVLKEEVDELWDAIKRNDPEDELVIEAAQVAAMCIRYVETT